MNLVKFKSAIMNKDEGIYPSEWQDNPNLDELIDTFNTYLKGKYCYYLRFTYAIPFDKEIGLTDEQYINYERTNTIPNGTEYLVWNINNDSWAEFIDDVNTTKANSTSKYRSLNTYEPDKDITIDMLKMFRTWLATVLYERFANEVNVDKLLSMLSYYMNEMNDDAIELIETFYDAPAFLQSQKLVNTCGCSQSNFGVIADVTNACDILKIYRSNIHDYMVSVFSDIDFWVNIDDEPDFYLEVKKYIDGIVANNFPFYEGDIALGYANCQCLCDSSDFQTTAIAILKNLSQCFEYFAEGNQDYHKNFIYNTLTEWSNLLYEKMRW